MPTQAFDLRDEPWLLARTLRGDVVEVSLREAFARAHDLQGLVGELPTQVFALYRLLLAVLHRGVPWELDDPVAEWGTAWRGEVDIAGAVSEHLDEHADRFDLLSPVAPFYQVASLRTLKDSVADLTTLITDVPNNNQFFTTRAGAALERISFAEAARWLVHAQAYDASGIRSGVEGDSRATNGRIYPLGVAFVGWLGGILVEGRTLFETLLLNLVLPDLYARPAFAYDTAVWERPPQTVGVEKGHLVPLGPADLLSWQSRRVKLRADEGGVTGVLISYGDVLKPQNLQAVESMTVWQRSAAQERALKSATPVYMPRSHRAERLFWRGLSALLPQTSSSSGRGEVTTTLAPGVLDRLAAVSNADVLPDALKLRTRAVGMVYGSNASVVDEVIDDALLVHAVLLGDHGEELRGAAIAEVAAAEAAADALGDLVRNLASAAGQQDNLDRVRDRGREAAYFALDAPFRRWLALLAPGADAAELRRDWEREVARLLSRLGRELLQDAGVPAEVGRMVKGFNGQERLVDAARASLWFSRALGKALPLHFPATTSQGKPGTPSNPEGHVA